MSVRWMAVQYVGDVLRLPVVNGGDMDKPFGSSVLERDVKRIVVNPFSDSPQTFVPELENAKLRELCKAWYKFAYELFDDFIGEPEMNDDFMELDDRMRKLGVEV